MFTNKLKHSHQSAALVARFEIVARDKHPSFLPNQTRIALHMYFSHLLYTVVLIMQFNFTFVVHVLY